MNNVNWRVLEVPRNEQLAGNRIIIVAEFYDNKNKYIIGF